MLSVSGNFLFALSMLFQGLFFSGCYMEGIEVDNETNVICPQNFCQSKFLSNTCCLLGILAILVFEPMALLPYWCRTIRIYTIFKAQEYYFMNKKKPEKSWFTWIREPVLFRICMIVIAALTFFAVGSFVLFYFDEGKFEMMPSYTVYMCFMNGMCSEDQGLAISKIETHVNFTLIWLVLMNFVGNLFFITSAYKLRNIKSEFNIRVEILLTFFAWFITTQLALGLFMY